MAGAMPMYLKSHSRGEYVFDYGWADAFESWLHSGRDVAFIIGGPDGLDERVLQRADHTWALAKMTLPHALVRVVVAEQVYRAWSIVSGHPYHR